MTWGSIADVVEAASRFLVLAAVAGSVVVAATHWAVRSKRLSPFGAPARTVRRFSDPILRPVEKRLVRWGRNPQDAPLWLVGLTVGGGILLLSLLAWLTGWIEQLLWLRTAGLTTWIRFLVASLTQLLMLAILVRVIASWFGVSTLDRRMRPVAFLTDWLIEPIRRRLPPTGPLDLSPIVGYFALFLLRAILLTLLP